MNFKENKAVLVGYRNEEIEWTGGNSTTWYQVKIKSKVDNKDWTILYT